MFDPCENPLPEKVQAMIEKGKKLNEGKVPVRVNNNTIIFVKPGKATKEYVEEYRMKHEKIYIRTE